MPFPRWTSAACALASVCALAACGDSEGDGSKRAGHGDPDGGEAGGASAATGGATNEAGGASGAGRPNGGGRANGGAGAAPAGSGGRNGGAGAAPAGSGGSGGAPGSGGADAGGAGGVTSAPDGRTCTGRGYLVCEDFEDAPVGGTPDGWTKHGDESRVTSDEARHGERSLELGAIPVWERRIYHDASNLPGAHWGRIFYKVELPVPDAFVHSTIVALSGTGRESGDAEFRVVDTVKQAANTPDVASRHQFLYNVQPQSKAEFGTGTSYDFTFDGAWHCAEWHVDAATQSYHFYFDGDETISIDNGAGNYDGTDLPDSFREVKIGWINYQESPPGFVAWLDDVALDEERVGCE